MTEDISVAIRLGVLMVIMCALITVVVNLAIMGNVLLSNFVATYVQATHTAETSVVASLRNMTDIGAATAYKVIEERLGKVNSLKIEFKDGTVTTNHKVLLEKSDIIVSLKIKTTDVNTYNIEVKEVGS